MILLAPKVSAKGLSEAEAQRVYHINDLLSTLDGRCREFKAALALFDKSESAIHDSATTAENRATYGEWLFMAAREGAATIYKFDEDFEAIGINLNKSPTVLQKIDTTAKKAAEKSFSVAFPGIFGVRDSTQHGGAIFGTPEKVQQHQENPFYIAINNIEGRTLKTTFKNKVVGLDITEQSLKQLEAIRDMIWEAFRPASS